MYEYRCKEIKKVVDGDTVDVVLDLGFNIFHSCRVRMAGIDTPESRTRDLDEKARGKLAKEFLKNWVTEYENNKKNIVIKTKKEKAKGKFGRVLGELWVEGVNVNEDMIQSYHAVPYSAQNKEEVKKLHLENRERLIEQGVFKPLAE
tara:strand:- start:114 stop:554 length:441 start_codon:yes stop_codon:yes gene_type:complete